ncbi:amino acid racemase [Salmonella enterica subsp. enterica]|nr:amino acid racemase [Salmonella enterica subsp. enterica]
MVDMGDLREGIWFGEYQRILETVTLITGLPRSGII